MNTPGVGPGIASPEELEAYHRREAQRAEREAAGREKEKKEAEAAALEAERKESERLIAAEKERLRVEWIGSGGSSAEFDRAWSSDLREAAILERMAEREGRAAADIRDIWRYSS
jgi:hypothetical protein